MHILSSIYNLYVDIGGRRTEEAGKLWKFIR